MHTHDALLIGRSVSLLKSLPAEQNKVIRQFQDAGFVPENAGHSQGMYALFRTFCKKKRCLQCKIGAAIFKS
jgi:hypothetical protein